jgi:hypothetical protein
LAAEGSVGVQPHLLRHKRATRHATSLTEWLSDSRKSTGG